MIKIDLVTGFLGAGKTSFIKKYATYLKNQNLHIGIIENDFGAINIDMLLLQDIENEQCDLEPIVGGNVVSDWKRRFKAKLIFLAMQGIDRVIVEPSGIYDVDAFFEVLYDDTLNTRFEIGNIFTIIDAKMDERLSEQAEYLLVSQLANSGQVIVSKTENVPETRIQETIKHLSLLLEKYECDTNLDGRIFTKIWEEMTLQDYEMLMNCGWLRSSYKTMPFDKNEVFSSLFFMHKKIPQDQLADRINQLIHDQNCGTIFRVKGFFAGDGDTWTEVNATQEHMEVKEMKHGQEVVIIIGENLKEEAITAYFQ